ncbi:MAG: hypothetical protein CMJ62_19360 [Planctomycetaceae bacterium]|nr:hypothetical protein [Planctomycetaceae bacterium]
MRLDTKSLACTTLAVVFLLLFPGVSVRLQNRARAGGIETPEVGPATETRFPPFVVPEGFQATLFACDPLIEYPSVIAIGPHSGTLFVAHDYLTGLGEEIVRRDEVRVITDTDHDGYADKSTVYAGEFNSIQGLAFHDGTVFVMHAPLLTSLRDTDGDGVADLRSDLVQGLGLPPEENSNRLHCANGIVAGHDGWLYLALGDRGCDVNRPEGDRLVFQQGGILRCRPDGTDLHVFSTGLRNIYDIALDHELNVFVRDNENDGGDYMIRVCHCFFGSDHGYPYHYYEHPTETMPPLADLGRGSSAGVTTYLETVFPEEYQNSLFACEWGRAIVRYQRNQLGSSFEPMDETDFASGAPEDPYGFKPTDLVVDRDGSLLISDWCDGQRPQRGRGRIYRVSYVGDVAQPSVSAGADSNKQKPVTPTLDDWVTRINSPSYHQRVEAQLAIEHAGEDGLDRLTLALKRGDLGPAGRLHATWIIAHTQGEGRLETLFDVARLDRSIPVRIQAIRAIADLADPVLAGGQLDAGRGDAAIAKRLVELRIDGDPRLLREVTIALGRLKWVGAPGWLLGQTGSKLDVAITHAATWTLRQVDNWADVVGIWDQPDSPWRPSALNAAARQTRPEVVQALLQRCANGGEYALLLSRVYKTPAPYQYWGFRPDPRPVNTVAWELTEAIEQKLVEVFRDRGKDSPEVRQQILREGVPVPIATLAACLPEESNDASLLVVLEALKELADPSSPGLFVEVIQSTTVPETVRLTALSYLIADLDETGESTLLDLAQSMEDSKVLAQVIQHLGSRPRLDCDKYLVGKLESRDGGIRAAAMRALAVRKHAGLSQQTTGLLNDPDVRVRRASVFAAGTLGIRSTSDRLLQLAADGDHETRRLSLNALRELDQPDAVGQAVVALNHAATQLAAITYLADHGGPDQLEPLTTIAGKNRSTEVLTKVVHAISRWEADRKNHCRRAELHGAIARIQANSGAVLRWTMFGPLSSAGSKTVLGRLHRVVNAAGPHHHVDSIRCVRARRQTQIATGTDAGVVMDQECDAIRKPVWLAVAHLESPQELDVECFASSNATLQIWLNANSVYKRDTVTEYRENGDQFEVSLPGRTSQLVVRMAGAKDGPHFHLRFRRKSSKAEHERLSKIGLTSQGDINRGGEVFAAAEKSQCIKCHRIGNEPGRIGPDLTGIGSRFSRIHLIESILEPSRTVAPSYETVNVVLMNGRLVSGVKIKDDKEVVTIGDNQGKIHEILKVDIEEMLVQPRSTMPDGLEERLTDQEFLDLLAYLLSQKKK